MWDHHAARLFGKDPVVFDSRVAVRIPGIAENQRVFPVTIDARTLPDVRRIVLLADLNPIPVAVDYRPAGAEPFIASRIKLDQRTPVRAAVQTGDGTWHVGGTWIDAAGGGCSAPPVSRVKGDWADHLGEIRAGRWAEGPGETRLRITFRHPMDTGLVENIAAYNIEHVTIRDGDGRSLGEMEVFGSVAEDPAFTVLVKATGTISFEARDTAGLRFAGKVGA
ncbi:MAG: quinoprotein dehydrogenase-associated SoxYZ-like carrier [Novosphingobium sp.]|nr:quinoprotein dehydrogenase-associated SoxYZ-like carrier [Novosphingobium sp.]